MNVIGSRPDGWWRDRRAAMRRLVADLRGALGEPVTVVLDGRPFDLEGPAGWRCASPPAAGRTPRTTTSPTLVAADPSRRASRW